MPAQGAAPQGEQGVVPGVQGVGEGVRKGRRVLARVAPVGAGAEVRELVRERGQQYLHGQRCLDRQVTQVSFGQLAQQLGSGGGPGAQERLPCGVGQFGYMDLAAVGGAPAALHAGREVSGPYGDLAHRTLTGVGAASGQAPVPARGAVPVRLAVGILQGVDPPLAPPLGRQLPASAQWFG